MRTPFLKYTTEFFLACWELDALKTHYSLWSAARLPYYILTIPYPLPSVRAPTINQQRTRQAVIVEPYHRALFTICKQTNKQTKFECPIR